MTKTEVDPAVEPEIEPAVDLVTVELQVSWITDGPAGAIVVMDAARAAGFVAQGAVVVIPPIG
jgi:hypothetical protein